MIIRTATIQDLDAIAALEALCFPAAEACSRESFEHRLQHYPSHFWLLLQDDRLICFVDGAVTRERELTDEMFADPTCHREDAPWQMIFGVNTHPDFRRRGYAGQLLRRAIQDARAQGRKGLVLTCKEEKLHYYASFGFQNEGLSPSCHGGAKWYQMRLTF